MFYTRFQNLFKWKTRQFLSFTSFHVHSPKLKLWTLVQSEKLFWVKFYSFWQQTVIVFSSEVAGKPHWETGVRQNSNTAGRNKGYFHDFQPFLHNAWQEEKEQCVFLLNVYILPILHFFPPHPSHCFLKKPEKNSKISSNQPTYWVDLTEQTSRISCTKNLKAFPTLLSVFRGF